MIATTRSQQNPTGGRKMTGDWANTRFGVLRGKSEKMREQPSHDVDDLFSSVARNGRTRRL